MISYINTLSPLNTIFLYSLISTLVFLVITKTSIKKYSLLLLFIFSVFYFGPISIANTALFLLLALFIGNKIYKENVTVGLILGIFLIIQLHSILSLIVGTKISQYISYVVGIIFIIFSRKLINLNLYTRIKNTINSFNLVEIFIITLSFIISSQPQVYWDAVHANLYNAKWYFENNSLLPILESTSSLFPQNGIIYFSYFYGLGGNKMLQISYLIPLIFVILILKKIGHEVKNTNFFKIASLLLLATPIFIFESSNGYYDALITLSCISIIFLILKNNNNQSILLSSFLIGFAAGIKYFPIVLSIIPIFFIFKNKNSHKTKLILLIISFILISFPVILWGARSYHLTKNPVFPFAQYIFPTPNLWSSNDILENNAMIKTTMTSKQWILGGFIYYPIRTFLNSEEFLEAAKGYSTISPIIFNFIALIFIFITFTQLIKHKKIKDLQWLMILFYISFLIIGLTTRYYRYLWPYQTAISLLSIYLISNNFPKIRIINLFLIIMLLLNIKNFNDHFKFYPIFLNKLFNPNYFQQIHPDINNDPLLYLNQNIKNEDNILDASKYILPRFHINSKVTQCNWYWIRGLNKIKEEDILKSFKYIVISTDSKFQNYCTQEINKYSDKTSTVFVNDNYQIIKIK